VVLVELQVVSQMANTNPDIIGVIRQSESIVKNVINLDDEIDTEDEVEHETEETLAPESLSQDGISTVSSLENSQISLKRRKHKEEQSSPLQASPVKKKSRSDILTDYPSDIDRNKSSTSGIPEEVVLPTSEDSPANDQLNSTNDTDPHSQSSMGNDPMAGEKAVDSSSKRGRSKEMLAKILPRPKSRSSETENSNEAISPKKESGEDVNKSKSTSITREASMDAEKKRSATGSSSSISATEGKKVPHKKKRNSVPEGFKDTTAKYRSKTKRIEAPNGEIFKTYKACWDFVERNPDYLQWKTNIDHMDQVVVDKEKESKGDKVRSGFLGEENVTKSYKVAEAKESKESASDSSFEEEPVKIPPKENTGEDKSVAKNKSPLRKGASKPGGVSPKKADELKSSSVTDENSSSSDSSSEEESDSSFEGKKKALPDKKFEKKGAKETKEKGKIPSTPNKKQPQAEVKSSPSFITKHFSKTPKKSEGNASKGMGRDNLNDNVRTKKSGKSPQLSSTPAVSGNFSGSGKKKVELSEEISPILRGSKSLSSKADKSIGGYYEKIIRTSKVEPDEAQSQPATSSGKAGTGDKSDQSKKAKAKDYKKKNKPAVAGFL